MLLVCGATFVVGGAAGPSSNYLLVCGFNRVMVSLLHGISLRTVLAAGQYPSQFPPFRMC